MCAKELGSCNIASPHKAEYPNQSESSTKIQKTSKNVSAIVKFKEAQENRSKYQKVETANPVERLNTGAVQKAQVKNIGQYLLIQFGRVVYKLARRLEPLRWPIRTTYRKIIFNQ